MERGCIIRLRLRAMHKNYTVRVICVQCVQYVLRIRIFQPLLIRVGPFISSVEYFDDSQLSFRGSRTYGTTAFCDFQGVRSIGHFLIFASTARK